MSVTFNPNTTSTVTKDKKNNVKKNALAITGAACAQSVLQLASLPASLLAMKGMQNVNKGLNGIEKKEISQAANELLIFEGLSKKGVKIEDLRSVRNISGLPDAIEDLCNTVSATAHGKNAFFGGLKGCHGKFKNTVACNMDKLPTAIFHELGHAFNANNSKFWKAAQSMRKPSMAIAAFIALFGAFTKEAKPKEENGELTTGQKAKNFVRKNSGILAFLATVPMLAEEAMATKRGNQWAKELLKPDLAKKVAKGNALAYISYISTAVAIGLSAYGATKIKDKIVEKQAEA